MQQHRQPPRHARGAPYPAQCRLRIAVEIIRSAAAVELGQRAGQIKHVGHREVKALGAGRRHDMGGIAGEKQRTVAHRLRDEAAQRRDRLFDRGTGDDAVGHLPRTARLNLLPEPIVRPILEPGVEVALDVVAAQHRIAHRGQRKTAAVVAIANLGIRRRLRHDAKPAERIALLVGLEHAMPGSMCGPRRDSRHSRRHNRSRPGA